MRFYFPDPPKFQFFQQKKDCQKITVPSPVELSRAAPKTEEDARREREVKQAIARAKDSRPNAGIHRFLERADAVLKWWDAIPAPTSAAKPLAVSTSAAGIDEKPLQPFDLQDVPDSEQTNGYKLDPALMRQWFSNPSYAVRSPEQKECLPGAPFYPSNLVNSSSLKISKLLKVERIQRAYTKITSREFLNSKLVLDALYKICKKLPEEFSDVDPMKEFDGDLQRIHRRYAFASLSVGKRFPANFEDIRVQALDKSASCADDVELALGEFKLYAAIDDAHVFYNGRTTRRVHIKRIAIYIMTAYGFDEFEPGVPYLGHFNRKNFALVTDGEWVNAPVYTGKDVHAKNAVLRPVSTPLFMRWRELHNKGGDMLLFSDRESSFPSIDVVVPIQTVDPKFRIVGRIAATAAGYLGVPFKDLHLTLLIFNTEQGMIGIDGQPTLFESGFANSKKIRTNFYRNVEPEDVIVSFAMEPPGNMSPDDLAQRLVAAAHNFASYTEGYSVPARLVGETMKQGEYNSGSYLAGLLHSVLGYVPELDFGSKALQAPGWDSPLPDSCFKGEALK